MSNVAIITIGGSTVTTRVGIAGMRIEQQLTSPVRCHFRIRGSAPSTGQEVKIGLGTTGASDLLFAGHIIRVSQTFEGQKANLAWDVECQDYTYLLNRRRPIGAYSASATTIAQNLISSFSSGFTSTNVQSS